MNPEITKKLDEFFSKYPSHTFKKGEVLISANESPSGIFYVKNGTVRQYSISENGDERILNIYKAGTYFPMMWAMNDTPNRYYFDALDDVMVHIAPKQNVIQFLKNEPEVLYDLTTRIFKGLDGLLGKIEYMMSHEADIKVIFTLLNMAYRFGKNEKDEVNINLKMTHRELAAMSGVTRETFTREMKKLEKENLIKVENHMITIVDIRKLEAVLIKD